MLIATMSEKDLVIGEIKEGEIPLAASFEKEFLNTPWSETSIIEGKRNPAFRYFVAKLNGEIIGICSFYIVCGEGQLINIAVSPRFRHRGIGGKLLEIAISSLEQEFAQVFSLEVEKTNKGGIEFYKKFGFNIVGERKNFYGNNRNGIIMVRDLK